MDLLLSRGISFWSGKTLISRTTSHHIQFNPSLNPSSSVDLLLDKRMCHQSPAKLLRSVMRVTKFIEKKPKALNSILAPILPKLSISPQKSLSIFPPKQNLDVDLLPSIDLPPTIQKAKLEFLRFHPISIPPRTIYHHVVIIACNAMFAKHPSVLLPEEVDQFNCIRNHTKQVGKPFESDELYLPSGGVRTCLNCGQLT